MKHSNILSVGFLAGLTLLLLNDFYFKEFFHNTFTGKLSDFAGLFIFPIFLGLINKKNIWLNYVFTILLFVFWKSDLSTGTLISINHIFHTGFSRIVDYSDFVALLILPLSYFYNEKSRKNINLAILKPGVICLSLFSFYATSAPDMNSKEDMHLTGGYYKVWDYDTYGKDVFEIGYNNDSSSSYGIVIGPDVLEYGFNADFILAKLNPGTDANTIDTTKLEYTILVVSKDSTDMFGSKEVYEKLDEKQFISKRKEVGVPDSVVLRKR